MNTLNFRTADQKVLFDCELRGQLSDGYWENAAPHDHWRPWCKAETAIDPDNLGRSFYTRKDNYNFASRDLLDSVGHRMINYVRAARLFSAEDAKVLVDALFDFDGNFDGMPPNDRTGDYWDGVRSSVYHICTAHKILWPDVEGLLAAVPYTMTDLRRDLKAMMVIVRIKQNTPA